MRAAEQVKYVRFPTFTSAQRDFQLFLPKPEKQILYPVRRPTASQLDQHR